MGLIPWLFAAFAGESMIPPFSCDTSPAHLGLPDAKVVRCTRFPHLEDLYSVLLEDASLPNPKAFVVAVRDGKPIAERGSAAAVRFLRDAGYDRQKLELGEVQVLFNGLDAWPTGFGRADQAMPDPESGARAPTLTNDPFRLTVYAFARSVPDGRFHWTLEAEGPAGQWTVQTTLDAE